MLRRRLNIDELLRAGISEAEVALKRSDFEGNVCSSILIPREVLFGNPERAMPKVRTRASSVRSWRQWPRWSPCE